MAGPTVRKAVEYFFAEIAQFNQEIDSRHGVSLDEVLTVIRCGLTGST